MLITWTSNIQGWTAHGAFEWSNKMQAVEIYTPKHDSSGRIVALNHEAVFYDPEALVKPIRIVRNLKRLGDLTDGDPYEVIECLPNIFPVKGMPMGVAPGETIQYEALDMFQRPSGSYGRSISSRDAEAREGERIFDFVKCEESRSRRCWRRVTLPARGRFRGRNPCRPPFPPSPSSAAARGCYSLNSTLSAIPARALSRPPGNCYRVCPCAGTPRGVPIGSRTTSPRPHRRATPCCRTCCRRARWRGRSRSRDRRTARRRAGTDPTPSRRATCRGTDSAGPLTLLEYVRVSSAGTTSNGCAARAGRRAAWGGGWRGRSAPKRPAVPKSRYSTSAATWLLILYPPLHPRRRPLSSRVGAGWVDVAGFELGNKPIAMLVPLLFGSSSARPRLAPR